jgi:hypothetical protein
MANSLQTSLKRTTLNAELLEGFAVTYLYSGFDEPKPTPQFHREGWELYTSDVPQASVIAPRGHAKSSALTHVFILGTVLFRSESYVILISTNEELAIEHLGDITRELTENEELITDFGIKSFITNSKTEIIVEFNDGHQFRILARGSGQKLRGRKWRGMRPGLIVCDDLEDDEQVENAARNFVNGLTGLLCPLCGGVARFEFMEPSFMKIHCLRASTSKPERTSPGR